MFKRYGQRFVFWTDEARSLLQGTLQPIFRVPLKRAITEEILSLTALQRKRDWWTSLYSHRELNSI